MKEAYLDNSATTVVLEEAARKMLNMLTENYGNCSSLHTKGLNAERELRNSRAVIAEKLRCDESELYFTSGGTESNNLAIFGAANKRKRLGNKIITTAAEHSSVIEPLMELEKRGFELVCLKPDKQGLISLDEFEKHLDENTILVSMMLVNNELGFIQPIQDIRRIMTRKRSKALLHVDAVQAFLKLDFTVKKLGVDLLSITAHKVHGPKGAGALYIKKGIQIEPIMYGGEQQGKVRPGTEAIASIVGFSEAVKALGDCKGNYIKISKLRDYLVSELNAIDGIVINSDSNALPYIVNFSVPGIKSETMLHHLAENSVYVSSGSACAKGKKSHVLKSMGFDDTIIDSAIRVSFSKFSSEKDVQMLIEALKKGIDRIKRK